MRPGSLVAILPPAIIGVPLLYACGSFSGADSAGSVGADAGDLGDAAHAADGAKDTASDGGAPAPAEGGGSDASTPSELGCSDATREGFTNATSYPHVAACAGAFQLQGLRWDAMRSCTVAGNTSPNPSGVGCAAVDLCSQRWHVCRNGGDFTASGGSCASAALVDGFYASAQPSRGAQACGANDDDLDGGTNDLFGCSADAGVSVSGSCEPWKATLGDGCVAGNATGWSCNVGASERANVVKGQGPGGVLCCAD